MTSPPYWGLRDYGVSPTVWGGDPNCPHEWGVYVENTVIHEQGHTLGLAHSEVSTAVMRPSTSWCQFVTALDPDDMVGVQVMYRTTGGTTTTVPPTTTIPPTTTTMPSGPMLRVRAYKVKGRKMADLTWTGLAVATVDIWRDAVIVRTTANTGTYTDAVGGTGGGTIVYKVCAAGTTTCTNTSTATW